MVGVVVTCAVLAAAGGAYLLLGHNGGGGSGGHDGTKAAAKTLALPGCTTATAQAAPLAQVHTRFVQVGGKPFDVVVTPNGFGFVSLRKGSPLTVMNTTKFAPSIIQTIPMPNDEGEVITHDGQYLLVAGGRCSAFGGPGDP